MTSALPSRAALAACVLLVFPGCPENPTQGAVDGGAPVDAQAEATPPSAAPPPATASAAESRPALELLKMTLTTGVKKKEPVDTIDVAVPGGRVYAHLTLRNRSKERRKVLVDFFVNGKLRTPLELDVEPSWSYRTWGYNTIQAADRGELEVRVRDEYGSTLATTTLPIRAK